MNARGALVGFLLAGFGVLAVSSMTPGDEPHPRSVARAMRIEVAPAPASNTYAVRERSGERVNF